MKKTLLAVALLLVVPVLAQQKNTGVYYEIFVRSFNDSDGDGVGDIKGITQKLDYLHDLGINGLWLTPVHPSPTYHKYDVLDYRAIDPEYGTLDDYRTLVAEAHKRGIKVLLDFVVNHTSSEHAWFKAACGNDKVHQNYYVWSDTAITHGWYGNPKNPQQKYYAFFWERMPDLNFDNPEVRKEITEAGKFWIKEIGIDGFRLDAAQHIYEADDVVRNNQWWSEFRTAMRAINPGVFIVGEVWNKDSIVATYLKSGLDASFNFDLSGAIINAIRDTNATGFVDKLTAIHQLYRSYNPDFTDATFVSNHDQDRYCSTFNGDAQKTRMAFSLLMTLPGIPFLYYGEEIGMLGKFPDEYRREPFLWGRSPGENTSWERARYSTLQAVVPLSEQINAPQSVFHFYKKMIAIRHQNPLLSEGRIGKAEGFTDKSIIAYILSSGSKKMLVLHNIGPADVRVKVPRYKRLVLGKAAPGKSLIEAYGTFIAEL